MRKALSCLVVSVLLGLGLASVPRGETAGAAGISKAGPVAGGGRSWKPHVRSAKRYARDRAGEVRFAFIDLGGRMHKFHAAQTVPSASVIKVMFLAAYLRRDSVRHRDLNQSEKDLLSPMIRRSDNDAASRVSAIVGPAAIEALARDAHMRDFRYDPQVWGLSRISSRDQASFMYHLGRYIPRRHWHYARKLLSSIVPSQRWGVAKARPTGWKLFFKSGWGVGDGSVENQVSFLERHHQRVAIAVLTEFDPSHVYGEKTEEGIAKRLLRGLPR